VRHYLDHASSTPLRPSVVATLREWVDRLGQPDGTGDPGRVHEEGHVVRAAIEVAREQVAALAGVSPNRVIFTAGATEAANTAIWSATAGSRSATAGSRSATAGSRLPAAIALAAVEHSCVREAALRAGPVVDLAVDGLGRIEPDSVRQALTDGPALTEGPALTDGPALALVNCQWANHEVGTLQPVAEIAAACAEAGVPLHVDAAAAFGHLPLDLGALNAAFVSVSAHKLGGPAGVGALILGRGVRLQPLLVGGSEERARRAGAENLLGIIGFGAAAAELSEEGRLASEADRARRLAVELATAATSVEGVRLLGPPLLDVDEEDGRVAHIVCCSVDGVLGEAVLLGLDRRGVAAHSGSACSSEVLEPSPVLAAMGVDPDRSLRLSVGWSSAEEDVLAFAREFPGVVAGLRELGRS
jgi:cysteine desulfurase